MSRGPIAEVKDNKTDVDAQLSADLGIFSGNQTDNSDRRVINMQGNNSDYSGSNVGNTTNNTTCTIV